VARSGGGPILLNIYRSDATLTRCRATSIVCPKVLADRIISAPVGCRALACRGRGRKWGRRLVYRWRTDLETQLFSDTWTLVLREAFDKAPPCSVQQALLAFDRAHCRDGLLFTMTRVWVVRIHIARRAHTQIRNQLRELGELKEGECANLLVQTNRFKVWLR
jgi:hypothetical protein